MRIEFDGTFEGWRAAARHLLGTGVAPDRVEWEVAGARDAQCAFHDLDHQAPAARGRAGEPRVSGRFLLLARMVACHRDPRRWALLYRALWRHAAGETRLLSLVTDPDVYPLLLMARSVRRAAHKMKAFVRFRRIDPDTGTEPAYVAWFEPAHLVVEATAPFFVRRFPCMRWSILTPDRCAHWDCRTLHLTPGARRSEAPAGDELERLWLTYYSHIFNPAGLNRRAMRREMPWRYWAGLPETAAIQALERGAAGRVGDMLRRARQTPEQPPEDCRPAVSSAPLYQPGWDPVHDPGLSAARRRAAETDVAAPQGMLIRTGTRVLVGVAGWTDPTLTAGDVFYPAGTDTADARLRFYASRYPIVEVDSTYYALPSRGMAAAWAARTPPGFVFDVKAHGLMTGHGADVRRLPDWLQRAVPRMAVRSSRVYGRDLPGDLLSEVWRCFLQALEPLRAAGKLGAILLQFPRWFTPSRAGAKFLAEARHRLDGVPGAVEFRHQTWLSDRLAARTLGLLADLELSHVVVDGPPGLESSVPRRVAVTAPGPAIVRLHGRRRETWEARNDPPTERYRYLYNENELEEHLQTVLELSERKATSIHVIYNNCHGNYAVANAAELSARLLTSAAPR